MNETNDTTVNELDQTDEQLQVSRRTLLKTSALVGGGVAVATQMPTVMRAMGDTAAADSDKPSPMAPGAYEVMFPGLAHSDAHIDEIGAVARDAAASLTA